VSLYLFPVESLGQCGGLAQTLYEMDGASLPEVAQNALDRVLFPTPSARSGGLRTLIRPLAALGLAERHGRQWTLTEAGTEYVRARHPGSLFSVTEEQAAVVCRVLAAHSESPIARGIVAALQAINATEPRHVVERFPETLAELAEWDAATALPQSRRYRTVLQELQLITPDLELRPWGRELLLNAPPDLEPPIAKDVRTWLIRAGTSGENEDVAREASVALIGWSELGPLGPDLSRQQLREMIGETYGETRARSLDAQASSIYRFIHEVSDGDLVVLPLKSDPRKVSIGRIAGPYSFRNDGPFAGRDAHHHRRTEWLAWGVPYTRLDDDLQTAFGAQGTLSEIIRPDAVERLLAATVAEDETIHLVLKWSEKHGPLTIEDHRQVADVHGQVWWSVIGRQDRRKLAPKWHDQLEQQLEAGVSTYAYISGPTSWRTEILDLTDTPGDVDPDLLASEQDGQHSLWVKLANFRPIERDWLMDHLDLASSAGTPLSRGALGNQTNPLIVRRSGLRRAQTQRVWWVNQGRTFATEREQGFMWAPKVARDGSVREFWRAMEDASIGDLILHYSDGAVRAVSIVADEAIDAPRPGAAAADRDREGWLVATDYRDLPAPLLLNDIPIDARIAEGGPFDRDGRIIQGYFFPLSDSFVNELAREHSQLGLQADDEDTALIAYTPPSFPAIETDLGSSGLRLDPRTLRRYHASLSTRGFVILAGVSGGGKTWLAEAYAKAIGAVPLVVPVAPNWTANEDLIGFAPALDGEYRHTPFSRFLQRAAAEYASAEARGNEARPYHLILDEMNLARVEYYFAKFLSAMEQRSRDGTATIFLSDELSVLLTPNLKFIGTVNVDETTFGFADKVYDRAQLIELEAPAETIAAHLAGTPHGDTLFAIWNAVNDVAPFAFRIAEEVKAYIDAAGELGVPWKEALDDQLLQKVLPKMKGTDPKLGDALRAVLDLTESDFPLTARKARGMLADFDAHGLVSYF
jgi:hypothetical protein